MATAEPQLSVKLSLSSTTYCYSNPTPPVLSLTVESHADRPLTIFTWRTPFHPKSGMTQGCFKITDLESDELIPQTMIRLQRSPFSRVRGDVDEQYFLTLQPHTPTVVSTGFSPGGGNSRPQPRAVVKRGWLLDEQGNELKIRRSTDGCGVDGLEVGHRYKVGVTRGPLMGLWWRWGTKEEFQVERGEPNWTLDTVTPEQVPLEVGPIDEVEFSIESEGQTGETSAC